MSKFNLSVIISAAAFVAASATASAQSSLVASIPFDFRVNSRGILPAGNYMVVHRNPGIWLFEDRESGRKVFVTLGAASQSRNTDPPQLVFRRREREFLLSKIQIGRGEMGYEVPLPKSKPGEQIATVVVTLSQGGAE
ncbi:MAG TPA: hypothetical protein VKV74_09690 [Bryobacteraceae bacterium]|nr:hypothetical protein [Bryobacteraceae bacterium]